MLFEKKVAEKEQPRKEFFMKYLARFLMLACIIMLAQDGAAQPRKRSVNLTPLQRGEKIFKEKQCGSCHTTSPSAKMKSPDLTTVFTAVDTTFIKVHLRFQQETAMPAIDLTAKQIDDLARYVSHLHAEKFQKVNAKEADGKCPVCGALLKTSAVTAESLVSRYNDRLYYFECKSCKEAFDKNSSWHVLRWQDPTSVIEK
jgi:mono/diheme cytochrome c family protein